MIELLNERCLSMRGMSWKEKRKECRTAGNSFGQLWGVCAAAFVKTFGSIALLSALEEVRSTRHFVVISSFEFDGASSLESR